MSKEMNTSWKLNKKYRNYTHPMFKKLFLFLLLLVLTSFTTAETKVYICGPTGAKKYHYLENCRGLGACKHTVFETSISKARGYGLTLCGWED